MVAEPKEMRPTSTEAAAAVMGCLARGSCPPDCCVDVCGVNCLNFNN